MGSSNVIFLNLNEPIRADMVFFFYFTSFSRGNINFVDPPGPARLEFEPLTVVKGQALNLRCIVDEPGRPPAKVFRWMRGTHVQMDQSVSNWTIFPVSLEHRANFSCEAINEAGHGPPATVPIDVFGKSSLLSHYFYGWHAMGFIRLSRPKLPTIHFTYIRVAQQT